MYTVIHVFADLQDDNHVYEVGDSFPRLGTEVSEERIAELVGSDNNIGKPLIQSVPQKAKKSPQTGKKSDADEVVVKAEKKPKKAKKKEK